MEKEEIEECKDLEGFKEFQDLMGYQDLQVFEVTRARLVRKARKEKKVGSQNLRNVPFIIASGFDCLNEYSRIVFKTLVINNVKQCKLI